MTLVHGGLPLYFAGVSQSPLLREAPLFQQVPPLSIMIKSPLLTLPPPFKSFGCSPPFKPRSDMK